MKPNNHLTLSYIESHPLDVARTLERLPVATRARLLEALAAELAARLLAAMAPHAAGACLAHVSEHHGTRILNALPAVAVARILKAGAQDDAHALFARLRMRDRLHIERLMYYPLDTVGAYMESIPFTLSTDLTAGDALRRVRSQHPLAGNEIFVVDRGQRLAGVIDTVTLLKADHRKQLQVLLRPITARLSVHTTLNMARAHTAWQTQRLLPVIEGDGILVGAIDYKTVIEATQFGINSTANADLIDSALHLAHMYWTALSETIYNLVTIRSGKASGER